MLTSQVVAILRHWSQSTQSCSRTPASVTTSFRTTLLIRMTLPVHYASNVRPVRSVSPSGSVGMRLAGRPERM